MKLLRKNIGGREGRRAVLFLLVAIMASCERVASDDREETEASSQGDASLIVKTRASSNTDGEVSYPVCIYVMNESGECVDVSQLDGKDDKWQLSLDVGTYDVYAIAGIYEEGYDMPTKEEARKDSQIKLRDNMEHGDLMTASGHVTLTKGEKNTLTLAMTRKVAKIESVSLEGLPNDVNAVELILSPLVSYIQLDGSNSAETTSKTISLTKSSATGAWTNTTGYYVTESTSNLTIKVATTTSGIKASYSSNYKGRIEANHKLTINGKYDNDAIALEGVLYGAVWGEPETIDFTMGRDQTGDGGSSGDDGNQGYGEAPKVGSTYDNCVVVKSVSNASSKSTTVTLMTLDEYNQLSYSKSQKGKDNEKFQAAIAECVDEVLANFNDETLRLPTREEIVYVADNVEAINDYLSNAGATTITVKKSGYYCGYYFTSSDGYIYVYTLDNNIDEAPNPNRATYKLRGFKTLTFTN